MTGQFDLPYLKDLATDLVRRHNSQPGVVHSAPCGGDGAAAVLTVRPNNHHTVHIVSGSDGRSRSEQARVSICVAPDLTLAITNVRVVSEPAVLAQPRIPEDIRRYYRPSQQVVWTPSIK